MTDGKKPFLTLANKKTEIRSTKFETNSKFK